MNFTITGLIICLFIVFFQDIKYRRIHIILPIIIFIVSYLELKQHHNAPSLLVIYNSAFFMLIFLVLTLYMSLKNKSFLNPFTNYFGLGDLLYFIAITPLFVLRNYILFFILSMIFSLLMQGVLKKVMPHNSTVPLAGFSALFLLIVITKDVVFGFEKLTLIQ